jgi:LPXTG-motif cell wall-anchored protein
MQKCDHSAVSGHEPGFAGCCIAPEKGRAAPLPALKRRKPSFSGAKHLSSVPTAVSAVCCCQPESLMADAFRFFGLSCPGGGSFYICQNNATEFVGCCTTNPCAAAANGRCPAANLRASSFSADTYTDLPRQDCDDAKSIEIWYTCKFNRPPFMGCCASNPCAKGLCAPDDLRPAKLSGEPELKASFLQPGLSATSTSTGAAASATGSNDPSAVAAPSTGLSSGAIGGIVAGAVILVIAVVVFFLYKRCRRARAKTETDTPTPVGAGVYSNAVPPGQPSPGLPVKAGDYRGQWKRIWNFHVIVANRCFRIIP